MTPHELMTQYLAAARRGDWETGFGFFADDLEIHIPGRGPFAGDYRGKQAAIDYLQTIREQYGPEQIEIELVDMLFSDDRCALVVDERFHRADGPPLQIRRANLYRIAGDRIAEITIFEHDQYVVDEQLH